MNLKRQFAVGAATMVSARVVESVAVFVRNLILANTLGAANQGVAATFAIAMSFFEMLSDFSVGRLIVQADDGEDEPFQASAHLFELLRGVLIGLVLLGLAGPIAAFFGAAEATWAFRALALVPVLKGFEHLDIRRLQRRMQFAQLAWRTTIPQVVTMVLAYPMARLTRDYSAWLYLLLLQAVLNVLISHWLAERAFRLGMKGEHATRMVAFGLPLVLNGVILFAVMQGDRAIVGRLYTKVELGVYANTFTLAMMAGNLAMSVISNLVLPVLAQAKHDPVRFERRCRRMAEISAVSAAAVGAGLVLAGPGLIRLFYVREYWSGAAFVGVLGLAAAYRMMRVLPNSAQMAKGDTLSVLYSNLVRVIGVGLALAAALRGASLLTLSVCALAGEILAVGAAAVLLRVRQGVPIRSVFSPTLACSGAFVLATALASSPVWPQNRFLSVGLGSIVAVVVSAATAWVQPGLRAELLHALPKARQWLGAKIRKTG